MLVIHTDDLGSFSRLPEIQNVWRNQLGHLELVPMADQGEILLPALMPRMASTYVGFEVSPQEAGVTIALFKPTVPPTPFHLAGFLWTATETPVYYTPDQLREWLPYWVGPIQMRLRLQRSADGGSPKIKRLKLAYQVNAEFLNYLVDATLRPFLAVPCLLTRIVMPAQDGTLPVPKDLVASRVSRVEVLEPEVRRQVGTIVGGRITAPVAPNPNPVELHLTYVPRVDFASGIYQIEERPCVILRLLPGQNYRKPAAEDNIRMAESISRVWRAIYLYDQPLQVQVKAATKADVEAIANTLMSRCSQGYIHAVAYDLDVPIVIRQDTPEEIQGADNLFNASFRIELRDLVRGERVEDFPTLTQIDLREDDRTFGVVDRN